MPHTLAFAPFRNTGPVRPTPRRAGSRQTLPSPLRSLILVGLLPWVGACGDLDTGPAVQLQGEDPVVSLHFSDRLPTFAGLVEAWAPTPGLAELSDSWRSSWETHPDEGATERREIIEAASAILVTSVPARTLDEAFRQVDEAIRGAESVLGASLTPSGAGGAPPSGAPDAADELDALDPATRYAALEGSLVEAARHRDQAAEARRVGDAEAQLRHTLLASDRLRATTAEPLALVFIEQAEAELRRISGAATYPSTTRQRARRLLDGAREALDTGEPALALQRAWYAAGLLRAAESLDSFVPDTEIEELR
jgi:hypothetical protein